MEDAQRVLDWMESHEITMKQLAREMKLTYINVYHTLIVRPQKHNKVAGNFIVRFIATYGIDEAATVFEELAEAEKEAVL